MLPLDNPLMWRPAYTTVAGLLPLSEWAESGRSPGTTSVALARTQIQVTTPGKVKLSFNTTEGLRFWIDGRRVEPARDSGRLARPGPDDRPAYAGCRRRPGPSPRGNPLYTR